MDACTKQRAALRSRVTKLCNTYSDSDAFANLNEDELQALITKLRDLRVALNEANNNILAQASFKETELDDFVEKVEEYDDILGVLLVRVEKFAKSNAPTNQTSSPNNTDGTYHDRNSKVPPLPQIKLPTFGNKKGESYRNFITSFDAILSNYSKLNDYAKFSFLKAQLSGGPLAIINPIDVNDANYTVARAMLAEAFDNAFEAKHETIKRLSQLKLKPGADPYIYVGDIKSVTTNFRTQKIVSDDILQYFLWESMDTSFQEHIIAITNNSMPTLKEIEDNLFKTCSRYTKDIERKRKPISQSNELKTELASTLMATKVETKPKKTPLCSLCMYDKKPASHWTSRCQVYSTPKAKCDKLKAIGGCLTCSFINHKSNNCQYIFSTGCKNCGLKHMTYLCSKSPDSSGGSGASFSRNNHQGGAPKPHSKEVSTVGAGSVVEVAFSTADSSIILPTFTGVLQSSSGEYEVRVFRDGGSQRTFVERSLATKLNLDIISESVPMSIHGFNEVKNIVTQIVDLPIKIGKRVHHIEAIVLDEIKTKFNVNKMHTVVQEFVNKGYKIADKGLLNAYNADISDIGIVLGTSDDSVIPMHTKLFGEGNSLSTYLDTDIGVIFSGNVDRIIENLVHLPQNCIDVHVNAVSSNMKTPFISTQVFSSSTACSLTDIGQFQDSVYSEKFVLDELGAQLNQTLDIAEAPVEDSLQSETNQELVDYILTNINRDNDGRIIVPLALNPRNSHLLSMNYNLCKAVLKSTIRKLGREPEKLQMYDQVFKEQLELGIIEKVDNIENFIENNPDCSFLAHMGVFRMNNDSTKCRVVFLSNICEKNNGKGLSHNQIMLPGPCLNQKMTTAVTMLRFEKYLLVFDLKKAFLMLKLMDSHQKKLLFLWYKDISNNDYTITAFKSVRLPFGLVSSPFLLMVSLYKMLILDETGDEQLDHIRQVVYNNIYMDNGSYTTSDPNNLVQAYKSLPLIFNPYQFHLQQFNTNDPELQATINQDFGISDETDKIKLFGMIWDTKEDTLSPKKLNLNEKSSTPREILSSLNEIYDIFKIYSPLLLRARLFMQRLQLDNDLSWDTPLPSDYQREWGNISRQVNSAPVIPINRSFGPRDGEYSLIAFTDSSADAYGCVVYIKNNKTSDINFVMSKSKILSVDLKRKTMPCLELQGIEYGVELLIDTYQSLAGESVVIPVNISSLHIFSDNMACLHWLESHSIKFDKMQKLSVFVNNRLNRIEDLCKIKPIMFSHVAGELNPADHVTRPTSFRVLQKTQFYDGPDFIKGPLSEFSIDTLITIPNPILRGDQQATASAGDVQVHAACADSGGREAPVQVLPSDRFSSFSFSIGVLRWVVRFIYDLKGRVKQSKGQTENINTDYDASNAYDIVLSVGNDSTITISSEPNFLAKAHDIMISTEQKLFYPEIFEYFKSKSKSKRDIPDLVMRLNIYLDSNDVLRIRSKMPDNLLYNPILLPKDSTLTVNIVREYHAKLTHGGIYPVLRELRKRYWVSNYFSTVKKVLKNCIVCRTLNEPAIKLNQNEYRDFRLNPNQKPFSDIYIDNAGPFMVELCGTRTKVWLLLITCLFTRAINIKICRSANVDEFMKAMQLHVYQYGMFQLCFSDLGSNIQAGANLIKSFLDDPDTKDYFDKNQMKSVSFQHCPKGNSSLASLIEIQVKFTKQLIYKSIRTVMLNYFEFDFLMYKIIDLLNKRPIAFKESLRGLPEDAVPFCITPEILLKGYECCTINIIPKFQGYDEEVVDPSFDPTSTDELVDSYHKLVAVKSRLIDLYHSEFLGTLINQAIDKRDRYKPVQHKVLKPGDIVLLVDKLRKRYHFPMGRVKEVEYNSLGESTAAYVFKGSTKELVYRHATSLILLISVDGFVDTNQTKSINPTNSGSIVNNTNQKVTANNGVRRQPSRKAAKICKLKLKDQADDLYDL